jgi:MraZ protein
MACPDKMGLANQVSGRALILGCGLSVIDRKGRVALPPDMRNAVLSNSEARTIFLSRHAESQALAGFDGAMLAQFKSQIDTSDNARATSGAAGMNYGTRRTSFQTIETVPFDASGRFTLSPAMCKRGGLTDLAFFIGLGDLFEVWNPHLLLADANVEEPTKDEARWALEDKGLL